MILMPNKDAQFLCSEFMHDTDLLEYLRAIFVTTQIKNTIEL